MPSIGPELPPHLLAKRKRVAEEEAEPVAARKPLPDTTRFSSPGGEQSTEKRRRIAGPTLPPAPLDELPPSTPPSGEAPEEDDWSDNDEYGPAVPTSEAVAPPRTDLNLSTDDSPPNPNDATKVKRDEWMTLPPTADGLSSRLDPTKPRARKFNTGKGARGPNHANGSDNAVWTETPEQKRRRLEDEVMGVVRPAAASGKDTKTQLPSVKDGEIARRIREHDEKTRGKSLYERHRTKPSREKEDDPSQRPFDKEKDMGSGIKIGHAKRKEMLNRASDFSSRFSSGSYL